MDKYAHLRAKAIELRRDHHLSLDEIVERLGLPRTTIYGWIRDIPLGRSKRLNHLRASEVNRDNARQKRDAAYKEGVAALPALLQEPTFRDFVVLYMAEGYRRNRNEVSLANSEPRIVKVAHHWLQRLATNKLYYSLQCHIDHDEDELKRFWATLLAITPEQIRVIRKSNSNQLSGRQWRSIYGVMTVKVADTYLRARIQAWMNALKQEWDVHCGV
jgi:hypothetical protein